jgi:hypothetical protein
MKKSLLILSIWLLMILISCSSTKDFVLFSDNIAPPARPELTRLTDDDILQQFRVLSENLIKAMTTIERWEVYQDNQDYYYTKVVHK